MLIVLCSKTHFSNWRTHHLKYIPVSLKEYFFVFIEFFKSFKEVVLHRVVLYSVFLFVDTFFAIYFEIFKFNYGFCIHSTFAKNSSSKNNQVFKVKTFSITGRRREAFLQRVCGRHRLVVVLFSERYSIVRSILRSYHQFFEVIIFVHLSFYFIFHVIFMISC